MTYYLFGAKNGKCRVSGETLFTSVIAELDNFACQSAGTFQDLLLRTVKELPRWKASELRLFFHYTGVVLFKNFLPKVHNLLHVTEDVKRFGPLYWFRAYRFESYYGIMKRYLRKNDRLLQPLIKRLQEERENKLPQNVRERSCEFRFSGKHNSGPLPNDCQGDQYRFLECVDKFKVSCKTPDRCVILKYLSVLIIRNILKSSQGSFIVGGKFENKRDLYVTPLTSSSFYEYLVSRLSVLQAWNVLEIMCKAFIVPARSTFDNTLAVFPIK